MENLIFTDDIEECIGYDANEYLPHIFVTNGSMEFVINDKFYHADSGDCVIPSIAKPLTNLRTFPGFECRCMLAHLDFIDSIRMNVHYNIKGHMDLIDNPLIRLLPSEMEQCLHNIDEVRERASKPFHLYYQESIKRVFQLFVLDMYDIHSRNSDYLTSEASSANILVRKFITMLESGDYIQHRNTSYYAEKLNITPGYLTEVCKSTTNRAPGYWIDIYMANEIRRLLSDVRLQISDISEKLNFNSESYFTRYCKRVLGDTPLKIRNRV